MLQDIPTESANYTLYRLTVDPEYKRLMDEYGFGSEKSEEMWRFLHRYRIDFKIDQLLDVPFTYDQEEGGKRTRYSDGSFPVFYAALEPETATEEVRFWLSKKLLGSSVPVFYVRLCCIFSGSIKDLCPQQSQPGWMDLMHDKNYAFCNALGSEAKQLKLDGLLVPSVRKKSGTNLPVFEQGSLRDARLESYVEASYDSSANAVRIKDI